MQQAKNDKNKFPPLISETISVCYSHKLTGSRDIQGVLRINIVLHSKDAILFSKNVSLLSEEKVHLQGKMLQNLVRSSPRRFLKCLYMMCCIFLASFTRYISFPLVPRHARWTGSASEASKKVEVFVDDKLVLCEPGTTVLQVLGI